MNILKNHKKRVVIIGAGFGGIMLAKKLNKKQFQVVLLDKNNYHTFQPLLYQVATAGLEPDSIAHSVRTLFRGEKDFFFRIAHVKHIHIAEKIVETNIGSLSYDFLVIATGSATNFYSNAEIESNAMAMKTIPEALNLRSLVLQNMEAALLTDDKKERQRLLNFVIVGGGPTGVELAGAFAELRNHVLQNDYPDLNVARMNVHLIQAENCLLPGFSKFSSKKAQQYLEEMHVDILLNTLVKNYDGKTVYTDEKNLEANTLIWTAGVKGALIDGFSDENIRGGRYLTDPFNQIKGTEGIFAIGDIAAMISEEYPKGYPMVAQPAIQQAKNLARNLNGMQQGKAMRPFRYNDKGAMATIGRNKAVADIGKMHFGGFLAWFIWMVVHLVSLVGFRNKVVALANWIVEYFHYNKGVRLIIRPYKQKEFSDSPLMEDSGKE